MSAGRPRSRSSAGGSTSRSPRRSGRSGRAAACSRPRRRRSGSGRSSASCARRTASSRAINSAFPRDVAMVGGRRFWSYRLAKDDDVGDEEFFAMLSACFDALAAEFAASGEGPVGVCLLVVDTVFLERQLRGDLAPVRVPACGILPRGHPAAAPLLRGRPDLMRPEDWPLEEGYSIELLAESDRAEAEDVVEFWTARGCDGPHPGRGSRPPGPARRCSMTAVRSSGSPASTAAVPAPRRRLWFQRGFVAERTGRATSACSSRSSGIDHLERRFDAGRDTQRHGSHPGARERGPEALLQPAAGSRRPTWSSSA